MPKQGIALRSRRVLTPDGVSAHDVQIDGDVITALARYGSSSEAEDLGDLVLMPAGIDVHVHVNEPGRTHWEGLRTATRAAAAGGLRKIVDMPLNSSPVATTPAALRSKLDAAKRRRAAQELHCDVAFYAGLVPENALDRTLLERLAEQPIAGFKAFLCDSGLAEFPAVEERHLRAAMPVIARTGHRLLAHAEILDAEPVLSGGDYAQFEASRPPSVEVEAIERLAELCEETRCPVHIVHVASAEAIDVVRSAKKRGLPFSAETCPHYLTFDGAALPPGSNLWKCAPPLRGPEHREALWQALEDGTLDFVATDHSPCPPEDKRLHSGDPASFDEAWGGIASLQLLLPAVWTGLRERHGEDAGLKRLARWLCEAPAQWLGESFGGERGGTLSVGQPAHLVAWDPLARFTVRGQDLEHRHAPTPYEGLELFGAVHSTWVRGRRTYSRGEVTTPSAIEVAMPMGDGPPLARLDAAALRERLAHCCAAERWIEAMLSGGPFTSAQDAFDRCEKAFEDLEDQDWLETFAAHPQIGDVETLAEKYRGTAELASSEQAATATASHETLERLAHGNREYLDRFGFLFIVFASGKSAEEMLSLLEERRGNRRREEMANAAAEQRKITRLRLDGLLENQA
ncbi:MAG: allantoinase AllB [Acidobacteriota bacterium]